MNRKFATGCGCLVLIVITVIGGAFFGARHFFEKGKGWLAAQVEDSKKRGALESAWQPPSLRPDAIDLGPWARFATPQLVTLWRTVITTWR